MMRRASRRGRHAGHSKPVDCFAETLPNEVGPHSMATHALDLGFGHQRNKRAMLTPTGIPASASVQIVRRRCTSAAVRGPSAREMAGSNVVTVTAAIAWLLAPVGRSERRRVRSVRIWL